MKNRTVNLNNIKVKGTLTFATNLNEFPMYPDIGETALVRGALFIYTQLDGIKTWYQLTERRDTYFHVQNVNNKKWIINHNFNTEECTFFVYIEDTLTKDYKVSYTDINRMELTFGSPVKGTVTVFKFPEVNTIDITAETATIKKDFKWKAGFSSFNRFPSANEHTGMITIAKDTGLLYYSNGKEWTKVVTIKNEAELVSKVEKLILPKFSNIDYQDIINKPNLDNIGVDWKYIKNKPELNNNDYTNLKNTPVLVYSREIVVQTQSRLKYTFSEQNGQNLFINSSWLQIFIDGKLLSPTKYKQLNDYEIEFVDGKDLNSVIQLVTIK